MPTLVNYLLGHALGVKPPPFPREYANMSPSGLPSWSVTLGAQNLVMQQTPYFYGSARGPSVQVVLTHNSLTDSGVTALFTIDSELKLMFGRRWWCNYQSFIELVEGEEDPSLAKVRMPDLRLDTYEPTDEEFEEWAPVAGSGIFNKLKFFTNGTDYFELELANHTVLRYEDLGFVLSNGNRCFQLVSITDSIGQTLTLGWHSTDKWKLVTVTDASGRVTTLNYTGDRVSSITPVSGSGLDAPLFSYNGNDRLDAVTNQSGYEARYDYFEFESLETDLLAAVRYDRGLGEEEREITAGFDYEEFAEEIFGLTGTTDFMEATRSYAFAAIGDIPTVTVTDENENQTRHFLELGYGFSYKITEALGTALERSIYQVFDPELRLPIRTISRNLQVVDYEYDGGTPLDPPRGNLTKVTQWMELFSGDPDTDPMEAMSGDNIITTHAYNNNDDPTVTVEASGTALARTTTNTYGDANFPHNITDIEDALGKHTVNEYWASGNGAGKVKQTTDRNGNTTKFDYDDNWNLLYSKDPMWDSGDPEQHRQSFTYDTIDRLETERDDALKQTITHAYDNLHREIETDFPNGTYTENTYDSCALRQTRDQAGNLIQYDYDDCGRQIKGVDQEGRVTEQEFDPAGNRTKLKVKMGESGGGGFTVSAWVKDFNEAFSYLNGIISLGNTNLGADDTFNGLFVDVVGVVTYMSTQAVGSGKHHIYWRYDGSGSFADPHMELYFDGSKVTLTPNTGGTAPNFTGDLIVGKAQGNYNGKLDQVAIWNTDKGAGSFLSALYNSGNGRIIANNEDHLIFLALYNNSLADETGTFTPSLSGTATYVDPLITDAPSGTLKAFSFNGSTTINYGACPDFDAGGGGEAIYETTVWDYDELNRPKKETDPLGKFKQFAYDELDMTNHLIRNTETNEDEVEIKRAYDALGRLRRIEPPASEDLVVIDYDKLHRRTQMQESTGTVVWEYGDVLNREVSVTTPQAENPMVIVSDDEGRRKTLTNPDGDVLSYWYDPASKLTHIRDGAEETDPAWVTFSYDGGNRLTQKLLRNGVKTTFDYDDHMVGDENQGMNRITDIKHFKTVAEEDDELLIHLQWPREEYDPLGNRLRMNRVKFPYVGGQFGDGSYVKYAYDKTSQLLKEQMFLADDTEFLKQEVPAAGGYDAAGNRLQYNITDHGIEKQIASSYDEANQINARNVSFPSIPDQQWQTTFAHDFRGNTTQKDQPAGAGQEAVTWNYTFNIFNKLTKVEKTKLGVKTECGFKYGADGYRVEKELAGGAGVSPVKRLYILDGVHVILEKEIVGEGEPVTKVRYIPGVCMITKDNEANEVIRYYHEDALGSFIAMTDEHQNLTALYQYDAWGNELLTQVSALSSPPSENPYRWCGAWGYYRDRDAQMYLLGMRWYDPQTGRFISRDPIGLEGGDGNFFRYVINSPTMWSDPSGLIGRGWPKDCADVFDPAGLNWAKDLAQNIRNRFPRYVNSPDHRHYDVLKRACEGLYRTLKLIAECSGERSPAAAAALQAALPFFEKAKSLCDKLQPPSSGSPPVPVVDPVLSPSPARAPAPNTPPLWLRILGIGVSVGGRIISLPFLFIPSEFLPMPPDEPPQA